MENVAVFPVPDWAWAMTSCPFTTGTIARCWMAEGRSKLETSQYPIFGGNKERWSLPVSVDTTEKLWL